MARPPGSVIVCAMGSDYLVEVTTIQGQSVRFGPYALAAAQQVEAEIRSHLGNDELVFASAVDAKGHPAGAWTMSGKGIATVHVIAATANPAPTSGRLQVRTWSAPYPPP